MATVDSDSVAQDQIKAFIERIERLEEERKSIAGDIAEVYAEARGNGFDKKALKTVVRIRAMDHNARMEQEALVELYLSALGMEAAPVDGEDDFIPSFVRARAPAHAHVENTSEFPDQVSWETEPDAALRPQTGGNETPVAPLQQDGSEPIEAHNLNRAGSTPAPATISEPAPAILPSLDAAGAVAASRSAADPIAAPAAPVLNDYTKPNPWCVDPDDCGVEASWNHMCGQCLRRRDAQRHSAEALN